MTLTVTATARTRTNLALHHLFAACRFTSSLRQVEEEHRGQPFGEFWEEILHNALAVAALTVASIESLANEMYFEGAILANSLNAAATGELSELVDRETILRKYAIALAFRANKGLDLGASPVQNADALIKLRNAVVHFRPEWSDEDNKHKKLSKILQHKFAPSSFLSNEGLFPRAWASGEFAGWALRTVVAFVDHFYGELGDPSPLDPFRPRLSELSRDVL